jgi:hypothetical protein
MTRGENGIRDAAAASTISRISSGSTAGLKPHRSPREPATVNPPMR